MIDKVMKAAVNAVVTEEAFKVESECTSATVKTSLASRCGASNLQTDNICRGLPTYSRCKAANVFLLQV